MDYLQYTQVDRDKLSDLIVLNLIINGLPSILNIHLYNQITTSVLNLIINGLPSIPLPKG